jgi:hypothetical protein
VDFKEKIAKIREVIGEEKAAEVSPFLAEIQSEFISVSSDNQANIKESMGRKTKLREQADEISDLKAQVEKLGDDTALSELKKENEELKAFQTKVHGDTRKNFIAKIESYKDNEKFLEVRDNLAIKIKTEKVDGKDVFVFDPESMDAAEINHSLGKIMEYESLNVFGTNGNETVNSPGPDGIIKKDVKKTGDVDMVELVKKDPAAAAKLLQEEGLGDRRFNHLTK